MLGRISGVIATVARNWGKGVSKAIQPKFPASSLPFGATQVLWSKFGHVSSSSAVSLGAKGCMRQGVRSLHTSLRTQCQQTSKTGHQGSGPFALASRLLDKAYVLDTRLTLNLAAFLFPSIAMTGVWVGLRIAENEDALAFMDRHFSVTLENLQAGRVHTLLTSAFGGGGNITGSGLAEACTFLLFGGNLLRSFGFRTCMALYLCGHVIFSSMFLGMNYLHYRDIVQYQEKLENPDLHPNLQYTPRRDRKALVLDITRKSSDTNLVAVKITEDKQRAIIRMPEAEFLEFAKSFYLQRKAITTGGGLLWTLLGLRLHPWGVIPVPYIPIPIVFFVPVQAFACLSAFDDYPKEDKILAFAPLALSALSLAFLLPRGNLLRHLPAELIESMKLPSWIPRHIPDTRIDDVKRAAAHATELAKKMHLPQSNVSKAQLEAMRKRNSKFQSKQ